MLGYDLLQHLSAVRSLSGPDAVSEVSLVRSIRAVSGMNADVPSLDRQEANFDSLPQLRWPYNQTGIVHR